MSINYKKIGRNTFRIFLFGFAIAGFVFCFVYFAMQFGWLNVRGSISERNSYFNIDKNLKIENTTVNNLEIIRDTLNCKTFFGQLNNMSLSNFENEQLVFFDFSKKKETLITFYTKDSRFFLILITSKYELNKDCINLLKLK